MPRIARNVFPDVPTTLRSAAIGEKTFSSPTVTELRTWAGWRTIACTNDRTWLNQMRSIDDWSYWLAEPDQWEQIAVLRQHIERGLPCGEEDFVLKLELQAGQALRPTAVGRPKNSGSELAP